MHVAKNHPIEAGKLYVIKETHRKTRKCAMIVGRVHKPPGQRPLWDLPIQWTIRHYGRGFTQSEYINWEFPTVRELRERLVLWTYLGPVRTEADSSWFADAGMSTPLRSRRVPLVA